MLKVFQIYNIISLEEHYQANKSRRDQKLRSKPISKVWGKKLSEFMLINDLWNNKETLKAQKTVSRNHTHQFLFKKDNNFSLSQIKRDYSGSLEDFCKEFRAGNNLSSVKVPSMLEVEKISELLVKKWNLHIQTDEEAPIQQLSGWNYAINCFDYAKVIPKILLESRSMLRQIG